MTKNRMYGTFGKSLGKPAYKFRASQIVEFLYRATLQEPGALCTEEQNDGSVEFDSWCGLTVRVMPNLTVLQWNNITEKYEEGPEADRLAKQLAEVAVTELLGSTVPLNSLRLIGRYAERHRVLVALTCEGIKADNLCGQDTLLTWQTVEATSSDLVNVMSVTIRSLADARNVYPVQPRLNPEGDGWICDQCKRRWSVGESSGCTECNKALGKP